MILLLNCWVFFLVLLLPKYYVFSLLKHQTSTHNNLKKKQKKGNNPYQVDGLGEINQKSIEGSVSMFFMSFVSTALSISLKTQLLNDIRLYGIACLLSFVSTITEAFSFRCSDNFFIPIINLMIIIMLNITTQVFKQ